MGRYKFLYILWFILSTSHHFSLKYDHQLLPLRGWTHNGSRGFRPWRHDPKNGAMPPAMRKIGACRVLRSLPGQPWLGDVKSEILRQGDLLLISLSRYYFDNPLVFCLNAFQVVFDAAGISAASNSIHHVLGEVAKGVIWWHGVSLRMINHIKCALFLPVLF